MTDTSQRPETLALRAGWRADPATDAVAVPIYQTTPYQLRDAAHTENQFSLRELGNIYSRLVKPTTDVLEKRVAAIEGGAAGPALAPGQAATGISDGYVRVSVGIDHIDDIIADLTKALTAASSA